MSVCAADLAGCALPAQSVLLHAQQLEHMQQGQCTAMAWHCRQAHQLAMRL